MFIIEVDAVSSDDLSLDALVDANCSLVKFQREPFLKIIKAGVKIARVIKL